jgi:proteasome lid subunit RPN8/RPN11
MQRIDDPAASPNHSEHAISANGRAVERVWLPRPPMLESVSESLILGANTSSHEQCGLIDTCWDIHYIDNVHDEPSHNFLLDHAQYTAAVDMIFEVGVDILGVFHTHPNNVVWPTPRDIRGWPVETGWRYWIVTNGEVIEWALL